MNVSSPAVQPFRKAFVAVLGSLLNDFFGAYRPELHYMRGPGPKWREKHGVAAGRSRSAVVAALPLAKAGV